MRIFGIPNTAFKLDAKALALAAMISMALAPAHAQTAKQPSREEIYKACGPEIDRSDAKEKATTHKYSLDALYETYVKDGRQAYLLSSLPGLREKAAKFPDSIAAAEVCTVELVTGQAAPPRSAPPPTAGPSSFSSGAQVTGPKVSNGRSLNEPPSAAGVVEGQKASEVERLENGARDYVKGGEEEGEDAKDCVKLEYSSDGSGAKLVNDDGKCPGLIEVIWCTEGLDCTPTFSWGNTLGGAGRYSYVQGTSGDNRNALVRWGACRGANTIHQNGMEPLHYYCTKEHK